MTANTTLTRKLPPFAREVIALRDAGSTPNVFVFAGADAWTRAKRRRAALGVGSAVVVPDKHELLDWRFLSGLPVVLRPTAITAENRRQCVALAAELVSAGARFVAASDGNDSFAMRAKVNA